MLFMMDELLVVCVPMVIDNGSEHHRADQSNVGEFGLADVFAQLVDFEFGVVHVFVEQ